MIPDIFPYKTPKTGFVYGLFSVNQPLQIRYVGSTVLPYVRLHCLIAAARTVMGSSNLRNWLREVGNRVETIAHRVAERVNPRLDPLGYAAALRDINVGVTSRNEHAAVGPALRQLASDEIYRLTKCFGLVTGTCFRLTCSWINCWLFFDA